MVGELGEIVDEQVDQLRRRRVIIGLVRPGAARVEDRLSTPGTLTGTSKPKFGSLRNSTLLRLPSSAALSSARVALIGMRLPTPYLPPVQPVLTSQQSTPPLAIRSLSRLP